MTVKDLKGDSRVFRNPSWETLASSDILPLRYNWTRGYKLSLGDVMALSFLIKLICHRIGFLLNFWSEFLESKSIVTTKLIKSCLDCIKKFNIYGDRLIFYRICSKLTETVKINQLFQYKSTFLIFNQYFWSFIWPFWSSNWFISIF